MTAMRRTTALNLRDRGESVVLTGKAPWPMGGRPARSLWRLPAAIGAVGEAVAHIPVIQEHLTEAPYAGAGFVLLSIAGFLLAQLLLGADTQQVWLATGAVAALALSGYALSRTIGLPLIRDDVGNWGEPLGIVAISSEALMLVSAVAQGVAAVRRRMRH